jgi:hypothetical protein
MGTYPNPSINDAAVITTSGYVINPLAAGVGYVDLRGSRQAYYGSATAARRFEVYDGNAGTPVTSPASALRVSQYQKVNPSLPAMGNGGNFEQNSAIVGIAIGDPLSQVQPTGVFGHALSQGTAANHTINGSGGTINTDATAVAGVAGVYGDLATGSAIGVYGEMNISPAGAGPMPSTVGGTGVEGQARNLSGNAHSFNATTYPRSKAFWAISTGTSKVGAGLAFAVLDGTSAKFNTGIAVLGSGVGTQGNPIDTETIRDEGNAMTSYYVGGTHSRAAIGTTSGAGRTGLGYERPDIHFIDSHALVVAPNYDDVALGVFHQRTSATWTSIDHRTSDLLVWTNIGDDQLTQLGSAPNWTGSEYALSAAPLRVILGVGHPTYGGPVKSSTVASILGTVIYDVAPNDWAVAGGRTGIPEQAYMIATVTDQTDAGAYHGRIWGMDSGVHGARNAQNEYLGNISAFINNYYNGSPGFSDSHGLAVTTGQGAGPASAYHSSFTTYPVDAGIIVSGASGAGGATQGFRTALRIGGNRTPWNPAATLGAAITYGQARIGRGIDIADFEDGGIRIWRRRSGTTGPAIQLGLTTSGADSTAVEDGVRFGSVSPGRVDLFRSNTNTLRVQGTGAGTTALQIQTGAVNELGRLEFRNSTPSLRFSFGLDSSIDGMYLQNNVTGDVLQRWNVDDTVSFPASPTTNNEAAVDIAPAASWDATGANTEIRKRLDFGIVTPVTFAGGDNGTRGDAINITGSLGNLAAHWRIQAYKTIFNQPGGFVPVYVEIQNQRPTTKSDGTANSGMLYSEMDSSVFWYMNSSKGGYVNNGEIIAVNNSTAVGYVPYGETTTAPELAGAGPARANNWWLIMHEFNAYSTYQDAGNAIFPAGDRYHRTGMTGLAITNHGTSGYRVGTGIYLGGFGSTDEAANESGYVRAMSIEDTAGNPIYVIDGFGRMGYRVDRNQTQNTGGLPAAYVILENNSTSATVIEAVQFGDDANNARLQRSADDKLFTPDMFRAADSIVIKQLGTLGGGAPGAGNFTAAIEDGLMVVEDTGGATDKLWIRVGGVWRSVAIA